MKLCRYGPAGAEKPGLVDADGRIRDLSGMSPISTRRDRCRRRSRSSPRSIRRRCRWSRASRATACRSTASRKFVAIGLNYADHAAESNLPIPTEPVVFNKCGRAASRARTTPSIIPRGFEEDRLGSRAGRRHRQAAAAMSSEAEALDHVAGYCVVNDVSERHWQKRARRDLGQGQGLPDTFGPVGPWLVTADEVGDPQNLDMWLDVNGKRMQDGNTKTMIFDGRADRLLLSQFMTLLAGRPHHHRHAAGRRRWARSPSPGISRPATS